MAGIASGAQRPVHAAAVASSASDLIAFGPAGLQRFGTGHYFPSTSREVNVIGFTDSTVLTAVVLAFD